MLGLLSAAAGRAGADLGRGEAVQAPQAVFDADAPVTVTAEGQVAGDAAAVGVDGDRPDTASRVAAGSDEQDAAEAEAPVMIH